MDPDSARGLYHEYGAVLCLDAPKDETLEIGIDVNSWVAGPQFQGLKLIPTGVHFFFYSVKSKHGGDSAPRTSLFVNVTKGLVVVLRWDPKHEQFVILGKDESDPYVKSVKEFVFDANLGAYPQERLDKWIGLSNCLNPPLVSKLQPIGAFIAASGKKLTNEEKRQIDEAMEEMGVAQEQRESEIAENFLCDAPCYYSRIPKLAAPPNAKPHEITALNMDKTPVLDKVIATEHNGQEGDFLGELQFAFVCFLLGQSFESFEQWKQMLALALSCVEAVLDAKREKFWLAFLDVLRAQLLEAPDEFFIDIVEGNNFLHQSLCDFFEIVEDENTPPSILTASAEFREFVEDRFGIPFDPELYY